MIPDRTFIMLIGLLCLSMGSGYLAVWLTGEPHAFAVPTLTAGVAGYIYLRRLAV